MQQPGCCLFRSHKTQENNFCNYMEKISDLWKKTIKIKFVNYYKFFNSNIVLSKLKNKVRYNKFFKQ
jgi:hypothetical protein